MQTGLESTVSANTCGSRGLECWSDSSDELLTLQGQSDALLLFVDGLGKRIYISLDMGRPRKPKETRRSKLFPLRLSPRETRFFVRKARDLGESVASILRNGGMLYIQTKSKDGSHNRKEKN